MKQYYKTREEKIQLLNSLRDKKTTLEKAFPKETTMWIMQKNYTVKNIKTGEVISKAELEKRRKHENPVTIVPDSMMLIWACVPPISSIVLEHHEIERSKNVWVTVVPISLCENTKTGEVISREEFEKKYKESNKILYEIK